MASFESRYISELPFCGRQRVASALFQSPPTAYGSGTFENRYCSVTLRHALGNVPELSSAGNFPKIRVFPLDTETPYRWHHTRVQHANTRFIIIYFYILNKHKISKISFKRSLESYNILCRIT